MALRDVLRSVREIDVLSKTIWTTAWVVRTFNADGIRPRVAMIAGLTDFPPLAASSFLACPAIVLVVPISAPSIRANTDLAGTRCHSVEMKIWYIR